MSAPEFCEDCGCLPANCRCEDAAAHPALRHGSLEGGEHDCPVCMGALEPDDICATDIDMGTCHSECLEGSPVVDLRTGEPHDGPIHTFRYGDAQ